MYSPDKSKGYFDTLIDGPDTCGPGVSDVVVMGHHMLYSSLHGSIRGAVFSFIPVFTTIAQCSSENVTPNTDTCTLQLKGKYFEIFSRLKQKLERVGQAVKFLKAARRKKVKNTVTNESRGGGSGDVPLE